MLAASVAIALIATLASEPSRAAPPEGFVLENPFPTATFQFPLQVAFLPQGRKLVAEKAGRIWLMDSLGFKQSTPYIDLRDRVLETGDRGLLGIAVDPDFVSNRWVYLLYVVDPDSDGVDDESSTFSRLERYQQTTTSPYVLDLSTRQVLIGTAWSSGIPAPGDELTHVIGTLRFGRDKTLLVGSGDAARYGMVDHGGLYPGAFGPGRTDPAEDIGAFRAQSLNSLCGKILRLDKDTGHGLPSNPYWNGDPTAARSRVWVYGLRNPYRFSVRPGSGSTLPSDGHPGTLYIADVGWNIWEELNIVRGGGENLGWPCVEGFLPNTPYQSAPQPAAGCTSYGSVDNPVEPTPPDYAWHHSLQDLSTPPGLTCRASIAGAYYTGASYPVAYRNKLFVADFATSWIHVVDLDVSDNPDGIIPFMENGAASPADLEIDPATGDVWYVSIYAGTVRRIRYVTGNHDPYAMATLAPLYGPAPLSVTFDASMSMDVDEDPLQFIWHFGDGDSATTAVASHVYAADGVYEVSLAVSDGQGGIDRRAYEVVVGQVPPAGQIVAPYEGRFYEAGDVVYLQAAEADTSQGPVQYRWDLDLGHDTHYHISQQVFFGPTAEYVFHLHEDNERYYNRIRLTVTQGPFTVTDTVNVYPRLNLAVGGLRVAPPSPAAGDSFDIRGVLRSESGIGTHQSRWRIRDGTTTIASAAMTGMAPGESLVVALRLPALAVGDHVLYLEGDPDHDMTETNEDDNVDSLAMHVRLPSEAFAVWHARGEGIQGPSLASVDSLPWSDETSAYEAELVGVAGPDAGWFGDGSPQSPDRLELLGDGGHVRLAHERGLWPLQAIRGCAAEMWLRPGADVTRPQMLLEWLEATQPPLPGMSVEMANGRLRVDMNPWLDAGPIEPHRWTHVVVTKTADTAVVYVNGRRTLTAAHSNLGDQWSEARFGAAVRSGLPDIEGYAGALGVLRLYDSAIGDAVVRASYLADSAKYGVPPRPPERVLTWAADSAAGTQPYIQGSAPDAWHELVEGTADAVLQAYDALSDSSGWQGSGTALSPWRLEFDGIDDRAAVAPQNLAVLAAPESITVAMWFRTGLDVNRPQTLLEWAASETGPWSGFAVGVEGGEVSLRLDDWQKVGAVEPGTWHHLVVTETPDHAHAVLDGVACATWNTSLLAAPGTPLLLGASPAPAAGATRFFRGSLARVSIWRGALGDAAAESLYAAEKAPFVHAIAPLFASTPFLSNSRACLTLPYAFLRSDSLRLRGFSVTLQLDPALELCGSIQPGPACATVQTAFQTRSPAPGAYIIDAVALGADCIDAQEALFEVPVAATIADGVGTVRVVDVRVRDCDNHALAADRGPAFTIRIDHTPPAPPSASVAEFRATPGPGALTHPLRIQFSVAADVESVSVYRAPFGNHPAYDDPPGAGALPTAPTWPPPAPWQHTTLGWGGRDDLADTRDCWSYAAFAWDSSANRSAASMSTECTTNYRSGDVASTLGLCGEDDAVGLTDLDRLLAHYGASLTPGDSLYCLDVGPTLARGAHALPLTDARLQFEDLMVLALDYDATAPSVPLGPKQDVIQLNITALGDSGQTFPVEVVGSGSGVLHGLSVQLEYDAGVVIPVGPAGTGQLLNDQVLPAVAATPGNGVLDLALLGRGPGIEGSGLLGTLEFRRLDWGNPLFRIAGAIGRDSANATVAVNTTQGVLATPVDLPRALSFSPGSPNPFRDQVTFTAVLPRPGELRVAIYDILGRRVRTLYSGRPTGSVVRMGWDGRDDRGGLAAAGVYHARLDALGEIRVRRVVRLR